MLISYICLSKYIYITEQIYCYTCQLCILLPTAITYAVYFSQEVYSVNEDSGFVQPVLILSISSLTNITIYVVTNDGSATGKTNHTA